MAREILIHSLLEMERSVNRQIVIDEDQSPTELLLASIKGEDSTQWRTNAWYHIFTETKTSIREIFIRKEAAANLIYITQERNEQQDFHCS